jgi:multisubunit Na+/H+ antiporter MnhC subunit
MLPLAVSGRIVIGVAVVGAILLLALLLRSEDRYETKEREDRER